LTASRSGYLQHVAPPWWVPPQTNLAETSELAIKQHDAQETDALRIYTDDSGINGHVGAAAVTLSDESHPAGHKKTESMGKATTSTVYAAELKGIHLALQIALDIHTSADPCRKCDIFTDNQAAIQAMANPKPSSGQYIVAEAIKALDQLRQQGWEIQLHWILVGITTRPKANVRYLYSQLASHPTFFCPVSAFE
jgi:ribonuclease HI